MKINDGIREHDLIEQIKRLDRENKPVIGCFPLYPPLELFSAFDCVPVTLWNLEPFIQEISISDSCIQNFVCSVVRNLTEFILSEYGDIFSGIFSYNACDSLRNLPEIILERKDVSNFRIHLPQNLSTMDYNLRYIRDEIQNTITDLENCFSKTFDFEKFCSTVELYRKRQDLSLAMERHVFEGRLSFSNYTSLQQLNNFCSIEQEVENLARFDSHMTELGTKGDNDGNKNIILSGIMPPSSGLINIIEDSGFRIVGNDIATLYRSYGFIPDNFHSAEDYYVQIYQQHIPCPTLLYTLNKRVDYLFDLIKKNNAQGIIFLGEKFCECEYFEFPYLEEIFKKYGVNTLQLELSINDMENLESYRTRIEAFAEAFQA